MVTRFYYIPLLLVGLMLFIVGGWGVLLWGVFLRERIRFETSDDSRNSWWVALLTFGEGWHKNHHVMSMISLVEGAGKTRDPRKSYQARRELALTGETSINTA
jgi:hypothetical protein